MQPDTIQAFEILENAVYSIVALTNGSEDSTRKFLESTDAIKYFKRIFSCDGVSKTKPHPNVYSLVQQDASSDIWMIAAHAWDIAAPRGLI